MPDALVRIVFQDQGAEAGVNRVSAALSRLERSEPTRALRQTRAAVDELANAASGLHPALGRIISTMAQLGIGGPIGIAAVGGIALIGLEIKKLAGEAAELEKRLLKANDALATLGGAGAGAFPKLRALQERFAELTPAPDTHVGLYSREGDPGFASRPEAIARAAEGMTLHLEIYRTHAEWMKQHSEALKKNSAELEKGAAARANLATRMDPAHLLTMGGPGSFEAAFSGGLVGPLGLRADSYSQRASMTGLGAHPMEAHLTDEEKKRLRLGEAPDETRHTIETSIGAAMAVIAGFAQGGAGGALGGLGAGATALSGLKGVGAGAANILGPLGIGLSAVSSLFSLFGGHQQAHVIIDGYDSHALSQQQQLMLALTGFKGLSIDILSAGGDVNRALYALGRASRTDGNMRVPPGSR